MVHLAYCFKPFNDNIDCILIVIRTLYNLVANPKPSIVRHTFDYIRFQKSFEVSKHRIVKVDTFPFSSPHFNYFGDLLFL